ncbi:hypothetical protein ABKV19_006651 [Rosa sericea]
MAVVSLFSSATSLPTLWSSLSPPLPRTEEALGTLPGRTRFLNKCSVSTSFSVQASLPENSDRFKVEYTPWMIVGLGNLGNKYHGTRHNGIVMNTIQSKALVGIGSIGEVPILVVKPQAYMNYSGEAVWGDLSDADLRGADLSLANVTKMPRIMGGYDPCLDDYSRKFYNRADVQKALHVSNGPQLKNWSICSTKIFHEWVDSKPSVLLIYKKLIAAGMRIWVYSGDTDGRVPVLSTRYSISALGLPITKAWTLVPPKAGEWVVSRI